LSDPVEKLFERRLIVVLGKGGVGRTSVSGALAILAARRGLRTLLMETDPETPLALGLGKSTGFAPSRLRENLWGMLLGGQESLEDYLAKVVPRPVLRMVFASSLYQYFVKAAPALRELTMMGKIFNEIERRGVNEPRWDLIIFDAPASGQAISMLQMPFVARESFGASLVGREATEVGHFFRNRELCAMVVVATAEPLAMTETLELHRQLAKLQLETTAVFFNGVSKATFENVDITRMIRRGSRQPALKQVGHLAEIARSELKRRNRERRALEILRRQIGAPMMVLHDSPGLSGSGLLADLGAQLAPASEAMTAPAAKG
jgi:anion-transporting  ArsA/GET3 family ATPase